jgi:hypothetical protein
MLAMAGDPRLAAEVTTAEQFGVLQLRVHRACARVGLWPQKFGTSPWAAAREARFGSQRYTHRVIGEGERGQRVMRAAIDAARAGIPVPIFAGGDRSTSWQSAVPRHVVLIVSAGDDSALIYDPSAARLSRVPRDLLLHPESPGAPENPGAPARALTQALGGWPHPVWAVLPQ